jgi:hypothetical protein
LVLEFLHLEQRHAVALVLKYKAHLIKRKLAEATVNRRLSAIKSMVEMGRRLGVCNYYLDDVKGPWWKHTAIQRVFHQAIMLKSSHKLTAVLSRVNAIMQ